MQCKQAWQVCKSLHLKLKLKLKLYLNYVLEVCSGTKFLVPKSYDANYA